MIGISMLIFLALVMSVAALLAVAYPILSRVHASDQTSLSAAERLEELLAARDAAMAALRDLNFDHRVGKIANEDFAVFEVHLKQTAADSLRALDAWEAAADAEMSATLPQEIAARRAALSGQGRACPQCGRLAAPEDKFCAGCGAPLPAAPPPEAEPGPLRCPHCGRPYEPEDRFCAGCGGQLAFQTAHAGSSVAS